MENKHVGYLLLGVSIVMIIIVLMFNSALKEIVSQSCGDEHSLVCPMNQTINQQTYLALGIVAILVFVSLVIVFSKPKEKIVVKKIKEKKEKIFLDKSGLRQEDKQILSLIEESKTIFQAELVEKSNFGKAKVTRILDRLENRGFIERKRRGLTNVVILKN